MFPFSFLFHSPFSVLFVCLFGVFFCVTSLLLFSHPLVFQLSSLALVHSQSGTVEGSAYQKLEEWLTRQ